MNAANVPNRKELFRYRASFHPFVLIFGRD